MKEEFLQMLQNYPKEDLKDLLDDPKFVEDQNILKMHNVKQKSQGKKQKLKPRAAKDEDDEDIVQQLGVMKRNSKSQQQSNEPSIQSASNIDARVFREESVNILFPNESMIGPNGVPMGGFGCTIQFLVDGKTIELNRVNLNQLVKKYVNMIFKNKSDKGQTVVTLEEFTEFCQQHPKLFNGLYKGFNYDVWGFDSECSLPRCISMEKNFKGKLMKLNRKTNKKLEKYCEMIAHFLLVYRVKDKKLPYMIICLDGLTVQEIQDQQNQIYGFQIFHKDKVYHTKYFYCEDESSYKEWTQQLQVFQKASISDLYSIVDKIGDGKFSIVYKGISKKDHQTYAIKIIEKFKLSSAEKFMLAHETEIMKLLNHSCIIKLYEVIETKTHLHIVTELVTDGDLFDYIQKKKYLSEYESALIMSQLFDTIHYIHSIGIVHRDLKPENIMIILDPTRELIKQVKIIDFGFANFLANIQEVEGEKKENVCGTTNYLAPESLESKTVCFKIDNFSLGCILYLMLSGFLPFDSEFPEEIIKNILDCKYDIEDDFWKQISDDAKDLIRKLLIKNPDDRISMKDALNHRWIVERDKLSKVKCDNPNKKNHLLF